MLGTKLLQKMSSSYFVFLTTKLYFFIYLLPQTQIHSFCVISRHTFGEQAEGVYFLFSQEDILSLLLQKILFRQLPRNNVLSSRTPQTTLYLFTWETLELHLLENAGQTCFSELVPVKLAGLGQ